MNEAIFHSLRRKLEEAFAEPWGDLVLKAELDPDTRFDDAVGGVVGGVTFSLVVRGGESVRLHHAAISGLDSAAAVDDWLAHELSSLLATHPHWPRRAARDN